MRLTFSAFIVTPLLLLSSASALALGMGRVSTVSTLGSPLEFSVSLNAVSSDVLAEDCISAEVYAGDNRVSPEMVRTRIVRASDGSPSALRISTGTRIDEPLASVEVTLNCGTRLNRKYVVFIDPPVVQLAQATGADTALTGAPPLASARSAVRRDNSASAAPRRVRRANDSVPVQAGGTGVASPTRQRRSERAQSAQAARAAASAATAAESGSRLKLESAPLLTAVGPAKARAGTPPVAGMPTGGAAPAGGSTAASAAASTASGALAAAAAASAGSGGGLGELAARAEADALALNAERLRVLEESLTRLRTDNQAMQRSMADLQSRLKEAEANRYANPLVYGLLAALILAGIAVVALLLRQANLRKEAEWRRAADGELDAAERSAPGVRSVVRPSGAKPALSTEGSGTGAAAVVEPKLGEEQALPVVASQPVADELLSSGLPQSSAAGRAAPAAAMVTQAGAMLLKPSGVSAGAHEATVVPPDPRREVSVEELIDLEQQADFFVVLGQDEAAVDLLMGHVQGTGGVSPLPYLKLLEIHRRCGDRDAYDRVRERFNRRFNAFAPEWESHSGHDRALEDYPAVIERLQDLWRQPHAAMDALAALLFQRDLTAQTFDLPAYGELLFLYSLARELAEQEHASADEGVDLLLPLDEQPAAASSRRGPLTASLAGGAVMGFAMMGDAAAGSTSVASSISSPEFASPESGMSLGPAADLNQLPSLPSLPSSPAVYDSPAGFTNPAATAGDIPEIDGGLLDLNISDEPEEPRGPLSKY